MMWTVYRHVKGQIYLGLGSAVHSETGDRLERYLCLYDTPEVAWVRPAGMFHETLPTGDRRFAAVARVRIVMPEDEPTVLTFGYDAWGAGRPLDAFLASYEQNRNHLRGTRYALETLDGELVANCNTLRFERGIVGIASVATHPAHRGQGHAGRLLRAVMALLREQDRDSRFLLFSEVEPAIYARVGFEIVPDEHQRFLPAIAMATGLSARPLTPDEARWLERYF
jgi:ribosomal protein S18 acetylase RimI-like enzyme